MALPGATERYVFLLRHGETTASAGPRRYIGQLDVPLSAPGRDQAREWAARLAEAGIGSIRCSDLRRTRETAEIIAAGSSVPVTSSTALREIALGAWEGETFAAVRARYPDEYRRRGEDLAGYRPPGGESFTDLHRRVLPAFESIIREHAGGPIVIVGHAGVNRVILCHLLGRPLADLFCIPQDYGGVNVIAVRENNFRVLRINGDAGG
ncbi:MAG: histidine phosphatase family protein [Deltaproteobacteria bacterium]|nr:histidine phosphatase family protein [Candidatus Anaeroferrophillacea bacterium]